MKPVPAYVNSKRIVCGHQSVQAQNNTNNSVPANDPSLLRFIELKTDCLDDKGLELKTDCSTHTCGP